MDQVRKAHSELCSVLRKGGAGAVEIFFRIGFKSFLIFMSPFLAMQLSCTHTAPAAGEGAKQGSEYHGTKVRWSTGTVEEALNIAKAQGKLVFLYWGAKWCPPCNHLKESIFSRDEAATALQPYQRIYLDGDDPHAQSWGEVFQAMGYPTMLVVDGERNELLRLSENVSLQEFVSSLRIVSSKQIAARRNPVGTQNQEAESPKVDLDLAATMSWYDAKDWDPNSEEWLLERYKMADSLLEKGRFSEASAVVVGVLLAAHDVAKEKSCVACEKIRVRAKSVWSAILRDRETVYAARNTLVYSGYDLLKWTFGADQDLLKSYSLTLFTRLRDLREGDRARITPEVWLWSYWPETQSKIAKKSVSISPAKASTTVAAGTFVNLPEAELKVLKDAYNQARAELKTPVQKNAYEVGLAYFLKEIGDTERAIADLRTSIESSTNKGYVYRALANLEESRGNLDQAEKDWSQAVREVNGKSSKIQWLEDDLKFYIKRRMPSAQGQGLVVAQDAVLKKLERFFEHTFAFEDSFSGRSYRSLKNIEKSIKTTALTKEKPLIDMVRGYEQRCGRLKMKRDEARCRQYFSSFVSRM